MIDIVYPLGKGSPWGDNELRYSLRSMEKHLMHWRDVYLIGEKPEWIRNVIHVPMEDKFHKQRNIMEKILRACNMPEVSDPFLFANDDHFLLNEFFALEFPDFYDGTIGEKIESRKHDEYSVTLMNTKNLLEENGYPTYHFDVHCPLRIYKQQFILKMKLFDVKQQYGFAVKSLYINQCMIPAIAYALGHIKKIVDAKINSRMTTEGIMKMIDGKKFWSISSRLNEDLEIVLNELYPSPSKFEQ